ncbi:MAG: hypothetical protein GQ559_06360 [Desulfobulbaceae bacterium]|nr:hypothetical protein [Desulfobulbaceae bacterium]
MLPGLPRPHTYLFTTKRGKLSV